MASAGDNFNHQVGDVRLFSILLLVTVIVASLTMFCIKTIAVTSLLVTGQILIMSGFTVRAFISAINVKVGQAVVISTLKAYSVVNGCSDEFTKLDTVTELA